MERGSSVDVHRLVEARRIWRDLPDDEREERLAELRERQRQAVERDLLRLRPARGAIRPAG